MKNQTETLNKTSGFLFLCGYFSSQFKHIPVFIVSAIFNIISLAAYLIGYMVWYAASLFYPDLPRKHGHWFGFAEFKLQYQIAALFGIVSIIICLIAPALIILTTWLYSISNLIWAISECHKRENPFPSDKLYSSARQTSYLRYAILIAANSIQSALSATIIFIFPPTTIIVLACSLILGVGLTFATLYYWGKAIFGQFTPDSVKQNYSKPQSYSKISDKLSHNVQPNLKLCSKPTNMLQKASPSTIAPHIDVEVDTHENLTYPRR